MFSSVPGAPVTSLAQAVAIRAFLSITPQRGQEEAVAERDLREAREAFAAFIALEAAHDPAVVDSYAEDGVVIERWVEDGCERPSRELPLKRYKEMLTEALQISRKAGEHSTHRRVTFQHVAPGWVVVRSQRDYTHSRAQAPYEAVLKREADGRWRVTKEVATIVM